MEQIGYLCEISEEKKIEWRIKDFFSLSDAVGANFESCVFQFFGITWNLSIYLNGDTDESEGWICLYLFRLSSGSSVTLRYTLALKSVDRNKDYVKQSQSREFEEVYDGYGSTKFISRSYLMERRADLAPSDVLTVICTLKIGPPTTVTNDKAIQTPSYIDFRFGIENASKDLVSLLDDGPYHDVEFTCGDQTIKAHKNILSCRSDVFASMLQSDMAEGNTGRVNIEDTDATIFKQFLLCLYTGTPTELSVDTAMQLYETSDKYAVHAMKQQYSDFLKDNLSPENACEILALADRHNDSDFKKDVMQYVLKEKLPIEANNWTEFCKDKPILASEVLNLFLRRIRNVFLQSDSSL